MPLRLAVDIDGVLADLATAYKDIAGGLFESEKIAFAARESGEGSFSRTLSREQSDRIWKQIQATHDFWTTLRPIETDAIRRLNQLARDGAWEVFFFTQRPQTAGDSVQRQTQRWLAAEGFELPSVIVVEGSRGRLAAQLRVDVIVDDLVENCVEAISTSHAAVVLVWSDEQLPVPAPANKLGITVVRRFAECLDLLQELDSHAQPRSQIAGRGGRKAPFKALAPDNAGLMSRLRRILNRF